MTTVSAVLLSLGSNLGNRRLNLEASVEKLRRGGLEIVQVSPVVETPAQLLADSPADWNKPFLNLILKARTHFSLDEVYHLTKSVQFEMEDSDRDAYEPRIMDIDILCWNDRPAMLKGKPIPAPDFFRRTYLLSPLVHMSPSLRLAGGKQPAVMEFSCDGRAPFHVPLWMGIINLTPDSFSDSNDFSDAEKLRRRIAELVDHGANIIDFGAESTRPGAVPLNPQQEWARLAVALDVAAEMFKDIALAPQISVDTYHPETAEKCLNFGVDMINDVTGLTQPAMLELAKSCHQTFVAMHSVTVPASRQVKLDPSEDAQQAVSDWIAQRQTEWDACGISLDRIIVDPGIGFGKSNLQNLSLMRSISKLRATGHRVLVGHSRKSILKTFSQAETPDLDIETVGASLNMCAQSVDILRVHNVEMHARAYLSWAHLLENLEQEQTGWPALD